jgi:DNA polymerase-3 subunit alpha/error-prone DNA polymerase
MHLQGLAVKIQAIVRKNNSRNYLSLEDFCNRVTIGLESLKLLIFIGAFRKPVKTKTNC